LGSGDCCHHPSGVNHRGLCRWRTPIVPACAVVGNDMMDASHCWGSSAFREGAASSRGGRLDAAHCGFGAFEIRKRPRRGSRGERRVPKWTLPRDARRVRSDNAPQCQCGRASETTHTGMAKTSGTFRQSIGWLVRFPRREGLPEAPRQLRN
jgi:hypothetical protein